MTRYMRGFIAALMLIALAMGAYPVSAATTGETPSGTATTVDDSTGSQTDPHISGTVVVYTSEQDDNTEIRYRDLATGEGGAIPGGSWDRLADVSGNTIVFTRTHDDRIAIHAFDAADETTTELDHLVGSLRSNPSIGGSTVVWEDRGPVSDEFSSQEMVVYDLVNENTVRLTDDSAHDAWPAVNSDGSVIVWEKCGDDDCDIWQATQSGSEWTTSQVTSEGENRQPDTNGDVVVYYSTRDGETDIFWQPVGGGTEQQLSLPGEQIRPSISGNLIAFETETLDPDTGAADSDILVYDLGSDTVYPITETPDLTERLPGIFVGDDGLARVVYRVENPDSGPDVHAFSFNVSVQDTEQQLDDLVDLIKSFDLNGGTENSLNAKIENAMQALVDGSPDTACNVLGAFINSVEAQAGKKLTNEQADDLIEAASRIQEVAGCR